MAPCQRIPLGEEGVAITAVESCSSPESPTRTSLVPANEFKSRALQFKRSDPRADSGVLEFQESEVPRR